MGDAGYYTAGEDALSGAPPELRETVEALVHCLGHVRDAEALQMLRAQLAALSRDPESPPAVAAFPNADFRRCLAHFLASAVLLRARVLASDQPAAKALCHLQFRQLVALGSQALKTENERLFAAPVLTDPTTRHRYDGPLFPEGHVWASLPCPDSVLVTGEDPSEALLWSDDDSEELEDPEPLPLRPVPLDELALVEATEAAAKAGRRQSSLEELPNQPPELSLVSHKQLRGLKKTMEEPGHSGGSSRQPRRSSKRPHSRRRRRRNKHRQTSQMASVSSNEQTPTCKESKSRPRRSKATPKTPAENKPSPIKYPAEFEQGCRLMEAVGAETEVLLERLRGHLASLEGSGKLLAVEELGAAMEHLASGLATPSPYVVCLQALAKAEKALGRLERAYAKELEETAIAALQGWLSTRFQAYQRERGELEKRRLDLDGKSGESPELAAAAKAHSAQQATVQALTDALPRELQTHQTAAAQFLALQRRLHSDSLKEILAAIDVISSRLLAK